LARDGRDGRRERERERRVDANRWTSHPPTPHPADGGDPPPAPIGRASVADGSLSLAAPAAPHACVGSLISVSRAVLWLDLEHLDSMCGGLSRLWRKKSVQPLLKKACAAVFPIDWHPPTHARTGPGCSGIPTPPVKHQKTCELTKVLSLQASSASADLRRHLPPQRPSPSSTLCAKSTVEHEWNGVLGYNPPSPLERNAGL
jgi:hypothetical protein